MRTFTESFMQNSLHGAYEEGRKRDYRNTGGRGLGKTRGRHFIFMA